MYKSFHQYIKIGHIFVIREPTRTRIDFVHPVVTRLNDKTIVLAGSNVHSLRTAQIPLSQCKHNFCKPQSQWGNKNCENGSGQVSKISIMPLYNVVSR